MSSHWNKEKEHCTFCDSNRVLLTKRRELWKSFDLTIQARIISAISYPRITELRALSSQISCRYRLGGGDRMTTCQQLSLRSIPALSKQLERTLSQRLTSKRNSDGAASISCSKNWSRRWRDGSIACITAKPSPVRQLGLFDNLMLFIPLPAQGRDNYRANTALIISKFCFLSA